MLKTSFNSSLVGVLLTINNKNTYLKHNNIFTYGNNKSMYFNNYYFVDLAYLENTNNSTNKVTYSFYNKNKKQFNINLINQITIQSTSHTINILDWYERELVENSNITILNLKDVRNLILPYSYKFLRNNYYKKQNYKWVFTNIAKKGLTTNNKMKIVL